MKRVSAKILHPAFVDRIFTTSTQAPFTNVFEAISARAAMACLCHARNAD